MEALEVQEEWNHYLIQILNYKSSDKKIIRQGFKEPNTCDELYLM